MVGPASVAKGSVATIVTVGFVTLPLSVIVTVALDGEPMTYAELALSVRTTVSLPSAIASA